MNAVEQVGALARRLGELVRVRVGVRARVRARVRVRVGVGVGVRVRVRVRVRHLQRAWVANTTLKANILFGISHDTLLNFLSQVRSK